MRITKRQLRRIIREAIEQQARTDEESDNSRIDEDEEELAEKTYYSRGWKGSKSSK